MKKKKRGFGLVENDKIMQRDIRFVTMSH